MTFQITALPATIFAKFFAMPDAELAANLAQRVRATSKPGFPCRVSLQDAEIDDELILVNHMHKPAATPYRASHAIFVRRAAVQAAPARGEIPAVLASRDLSLRAFDNQSMLTAAHLVKGAVVAPALHDLLANPAVDHVDIHFAAYGCDAARARRG